jgi:hypothetical protein
VKKTFLQYALPVTGCIFLAIIFIASLNYKIRDKLFSEKYYEAKVTLDLIYNIANCIIDNPDMSRIVRIHVTDIDKLPGVFAAAYDRDFNVVSERFESPQEYDFNPFESDVALRAYVKSVNVGERRVWCEANDSGVPGRWIYLYWHWINPGGGENSDQILMLAGVSRYSVVTHTEDLLFFIVCGIFLVTALIHGLILVAMGWSVRFVRGGF